MTAGCGILKYTWICQGISNLGSKGIGQMVSKNWCTITSPNDYTNYPFCRLQLVVETFTQLNKPTNQNLIKVSKVVKSTSKKTSV